MQDQVSGDEGADEISAAERSEGMLRAVLEGDTYDAVATRYGITREGRVLQSPPGLPHRSEPTDTPRHAGPRTHPLNPSPPHC